MTTLVTGAAGFIGYHVALKLLTAGQKVVGFDSVSPYYDPSLKRDRLELLHQHELFEFVEGQLEDSKLLQRVLNDHQPQLVIHLAAQAGVRYSLTNPDSYMNSNVLGTYNLLESLKSSPPSHLLFASTSSVYGSNIDQPFKEFQRSDFPISLYAATKRTGEALTHSYAHLFQIPTTCLRFFTVYGPWGRPDMALFKFVKKIKNNEPIDVYGNGDMHRDFTYIDDLVEAVVRISGTPPKAGNAVSFADSISPSAPWRVVNLAGGNPVPLEEFIRSIEEALGLEAVRNLLPMQPGDVVGTAADITLLRELIGFVPSTSLSDGVEKFVKWYESYFEY